MLDQAAVPLAPAELAAFLHKSANAMRVQLFRMHKAGEVRHVDTRETEQGAESGSFYTLPVPKAAADNEGTASSARNAVMPGLFDPPYQEGDGGSPPITSGALHPSGGNGAEDAPPLPQKGGNAPGVMPRPDPVPDTTGGQNGQALHHYTPIEQDDAPAPPPGWSGGDRVSTAERTPPLRSLGEGELREHVHRILTRVLRMNLAERLVRVGPGHYTVAATASHTAHIVTGPPAWRYPWELVCDCKEAQGRTWPLCVHVGAVLVARWQAQGRVVSVGPDGRVLVGQDACDYGAPPGVYPALVKGSPVEEKAG